MNKAYKLKNSLNYLEGKDKFFRTIYYGLMIF